MNQGMVSAESEPAVLSVTNLHVRYGPIRALRGVDLVVGRAKIVSVLGANGAGKSTLLNSAAGLVPAAEGSIELDGVEVANRPPELTVRRGLALVPEGRRVFSKLTVDENLRLGGVTRTRSESDEDRAWLESLFPKLVDKRRTPAGSLSGGEQQMLAIARALMSRPHIVLLDEPSLGLAPVIVDEIFDLLLTLRNRGISVLLVEQNVGRALDIADEVYVLATGRVVSQGTASHVRESDALHTAYFGGEAQLP